MADRVKKCLEFLGTALRFVSIGKYNQGLFFRGTQTYSTLGGGLMTLLLVSVLLTYSGILFVGTITRRFPNEFETSLLDINHWPDSQLFHLGDPANHFIKGFVFYLDPVRFPTCDSIQLEAVVRFSSLSSKRLNLTQFNPRTTGVLGCLFFTLENKDYMDFLA